ncbi:MAG: hypothetical protein N4A44_03585 [Alphaproteobacteria bacterium]|jgi:hypothetical protein|nr:hypothetical protein [Alphaproteobacteria bacterium]
MKYTFEKHIKRLAIVIDGKELKFFEVDGKGEIKKFLFEITKKASFAEELPKEDLFQGNASLSVSVLYKEGKKATFPLGQSGGKILLDVNAIELNGFKPSVGALKSNYYIDDNGLIKNKTRNLFTNIMEGFMKLVS